MTTIHDFVNIGSCRKCCVPESEAHNNPEIAHTYEGWLKIKPLLSEPNAKDDRHYGCLVLSEGEEIYLFQYYMGPFSAGGGAAVVDKSTKEVLRHSQWWIS